jgi:hypothetical protein
MGADSGKGLRARIALGCGVVFALVAGWVGARVMRGSAQVGLCLGTLEKTRKCRYCDGVNIRGLCSVL